MTKDLRDTKIEHQTNLIKCLTESAIGLKKELVEAERQRDQALEELILTKAKAQAIEMEFNEPKYDLLESTLHLNEVTKQLYSFREATKELEKETSALLKKIEKKLPKETQVHSFESGEVVDTAPTPVSASTITDLKMLLESVHSKIDDFVNTTETSSKKEYIKKIDLNTFSRTEDHEEFARSCILAYAKSQSFSLYEQFANTSSLMEEALFYWFGLPFHSDELKKLTLEKAKAYMRPRARAERAFSYAVRQAKMREYDFRAAKTE